MADSASNGAYFGDVSDHNRNPFYTSRLRLRLGLAERERQREADKIGVGVGIGVEKGIGMAFGHEKLDVYRVAMLTKLGHRGYAVHEASAEYGAGGIDPDTDTDPDPERSPLSKCQSPLHALRLC
jgi:hypothetical protein